MAQGGRRRFRCVGAFEREARSNGYCAIAGADEAGRGSLFGPVFAAAVILSPARPVTGLRDSKLLPAADREWLAGEIRRSALAWAVASVDAFLIDRINIYRASCAAVECAVAKLDPQPDYLLLDAIKVETPLPQLPLVHGDARCRSIAAASILAKVARDECMRLWHEVYPQYGLDRHKGYTTASHLLALDRFGPTPQHRFSFEPVRLACPRALRADAANFPWNPASGSHPLRSVAEPPAVKAAWA